MKRFILPALALFLVGSVLTGCDDEKDKKAEETPAETPQ